MKVICQNEPHEPALLSTCGARDLHSSPPFGATAAALGVQQKHGPWRHQRCTQTFPTDNRKYSKPSEGTQTWGGYGHCLGDPKCWQENLRFFWWGEALKKCLSGEVLHLLYNMASVTQSLWKLLTPLSFFFFLFNVAWQHTQWSIPELPFQGDGAFLSKWRAMSASAKLLRTSSETTYSTVKYYDREFVRFLLR